MADITSDIEAALRTDTPLPRKQVLHWIHKAGDLRTLARLYQLTGEGYSRIQPNLSKEVICGLIQRYLLACIQANVTNDQNILSQREAAQCFTAGFAAFSRWKKITLRSSKALQLQ
ncbi:MAG TPA: hypothetical protein VFK06_09875 [Candidatus Angelobacter sp.]|nr:hypothetical protein [Candidatus Angelobacter sp.]